ncbi:MAG: serine/threonine protein kinase [Thermoanaerobaculum sp.]|nr:serine/threonine protein kinase [Thermoanaerobaculum sp.]MDW7966628.1 serine/threonine-protein kinase [Thermoanaerobaculum sp.]
MTRIGKYEIAEQVGMGGFGVVYKAWDPYIQRWVALKTCNATDPETTQRFFREAQLAGNLQHPNITMIYDFGVENETPYFVQEFLSGVDLDELMGQRPLSLEATLAILLQVCAGLEYAHSRGVVHRDIKPANVRVLEDGTVKIMDFGIAKSLQSESRLTQTGIALGTAGYLSPEQLSGKPIDHRSDIFSLGVMAYEMVTGARPFAGPNLSNIIYQILSQDPVSPRQRNKNCPERLEKAILKALAKDPARRFANVRDFARELKQTLAELPVAGKGETTTAIVRGELARWAGESPAEITSATQLSAAPLDHYPTQPVSQPRRLPWLAVATLATVGVAAAAYFLSLQPREKRQPVAAVEVATPTPPPPPTPTAVVSPTLVPVEVVVHPPAEVDVDGRPLGKIAREVVPLSLGVHRFRLRIPGFVERTEEAEVRLDTTSLTFNLPRFGILNVVPDMDVPIRGTEVRIDGRAAGSLPLTGKKLAVGTHELLVLWPDGSTFAAQVEITDTGPTNVVARPGGTFP